MVVTVFRLKEQPFRGFMAQSIICPPDFHCLWTEYKIAAVSCTPLEKANPSKDNCNNCTAALLCTMLLTWNYPGTQTVVKWNDLLGISSSFLMLSRCICYSSLNNQNVKGCFTKMLNHSLGNRPSWCTASQSICYMRFTELVPVKVPINVCVMILERFNTFWENNFDWVSE